MTTPTVKAPSSACSTETVKTRQQRAEDIAYTINHAVSCGMTDTLIAPTISALFGVNVGCTDPTHHHGDEDHHPHSHQHAHGHPDHKCNGHGHVHHTDAGHGHSHSKTPKRSKLNWKLYRSEAWHYFKGEAIGDAAAVPLTILMQRFFPNVMDGLRCIVEPLATPFFRIGANRKARKWGKEQGLPEDAPEVATYAKALLDSEMKHTPQAVMWNVFAFPIGVVGQKLGGHGSSYSRIIRNKSVGALISNGILLGGRAISPDTAQKWDKFNSDHVILPATKIIGKAFGITQDDVERMAEKKEQLEAAPPSWTARMENEEMQNQQKRTP